jgi:hypothetical protein
MLALAALLLVQGVFAYLTNGEGTGNVFTVGEVMGELKEPGWGDQDEIKLPVPNETLTKDPVVTNTGKNAAYVFMTVEVPHRSMYVVSEDGTMPADDRGRLEGDTSLPFKKTETDLFSFSYQDKDGNFLSGFNEYSDTNPDAGWVRLTGRCIVTNPDIINMRSSSLYVFAYRYPLAPGKDGQAGETTQELFSAVKMVNYLAGSLSENDDMDIKINTYLIQDSYIQNYGMDAEVKPPVSAEILTKVYDIYANQNQLTTETTADSTKETMSV